MLQSEAIVLQAIAFKEYDRILTLFSPNGLIKMFAKGKKNDFHFAALTSPLTYAEFHYTPGRKELHRLHEGSIINQNLILRQKYEHLVAAEKMCAALLQSQFVGKAAPKLFLLFRLFIEQLSNIEDPTVLESAFLIKMMVHEGQLEFSLAEPTFRYGGERYVQKEAPPGSLAFSTDEEKALIKLAQCRSLEELRQSHIEKCFQNKVASLFQQLFDSYSTIE